MSKPNIVSDTVLVLNGLLKVLRAGAVIHKAKVDTVVKNSSLKKALESGPSMVQNAAPDTKDLKNMMERASMLPVGLSQFASIAPKYLWPDFESIVQKKQDGLDGSSVGGYEEILNIREEDLEGIYVQSLGVEILRQNEDGKRYADSDQPQGDDELRRLREDRYRGPSTSEPMSKGAKSPLGSLVQETNKVFSQASQAQKHSLTSDKSKPEFLQSSFIGNAVEAVNEAPGPTFVAEPHFSDIGISSPPKMTPIDKLDQAASPSSPQSQPQATPTVVIKPLSKRKPISQLAESSKQRKVPASRFSRLVSYGGLAAGLGMGALAEVTKRSLGLTGPGDSSSLLDSNPFLTESNATRIVDTLCRVRGAALKIGQILSLQDNTMISPQLQKVFERVRQAADFMPDWQMERILVAELGPNWRSRVQELDPRPFAAASIGQVHLAKLHDGRPLAIKIQYPGVGQGINSDIDNLIAVLNVWSILPDGIFIDNIITVAKRELAWEVDYVREAKCAKRFKEILEPYPMYYVPEVIDELYTKQVYATELIEGIPVDKCESLDQETRDRIGFLMLDLFFRELFEFQFMQTDPNWANFLYNVETKQIGLLDFGSSREYSNAFVDNYFKILQGAAAADKELILSYSRTIGFLTGYESKSMENAHIETVLLLGEAFRQREGPYDFGNQDITQRIHKVAPVIVKERLCPPPEEIYSLHRKLSGIFLLCSRLKSRVNCREIFDRIQQTYVVGKPQRDPII